MNVVEILIIIGVIAWFIFSVAVIVMNKKKNVTCCHCCKECQDVCKNRPCERKPH